MSKEKHSHSFLTIFFTSITPRSLAPKFSRSPITCSPTPCSLIARSATLNPQYLFPSDNLLSYCLLAPTHPVPSLLLPNFLPDRLIALPLIFEIFPCTSQFIDPWSILNHPGFLMLIVDLFASLTLDLSLPPTQSLVLWCCHWSSDIKSSSYFRNISLHLHSTIYRPLINTQLTWSSYVDCWLIHISYPRSIAPT